MKHDLRVDGHRFGLRPVERADSAFILELRTNPDLNRFLHETSPDLERQVEWIGEYEGREGDYYFIIVDLKHDERVGTIGLYNILGGQAEWGRWLIRRGSLAAIESVALLCRVAFEQLGLQEIYSRTIVENAQVVSFHESFGARLSAHLPRHFSIRGVSYDTVEHRIDRSRWDAIRPRVEALAARVAQV